MRVTNRLDLDAAHKRQEQSTLIAYAVAPLNLVSIKLIYCASSNNYPSIVCNISLGKDIIFQPIAATIQWVMSVSS